jgi:multicomponent Na+:H+ antiporter subunit D
MMTAANIPLLVAVPLAGAFLCALLARKSHPIADTLGTLTVAVVLALSIVAVFSPAASHAVGGWPAPMGILLVMDGLAAFMLVTVSVVAFLVMIYALSYMNAYTGRWQFHTLFLLMLAGMNGVVITGDLFNLFVFLEVASIASYALVAFGTGKHELEAAFKYAIMGSLGSLLLLLGIAFLYGYTGTLNMAHMARMLGELGQAPITVTALVLLLSGFALKAAIVPFHSWLPDAHPSAPAPISAMLSGVLIKSLGVYTIARLVFNVFGITPELSNLLLVLGAISMGVGVILALRQWDMKRLLAYHSVSQVGYIILGLGLGTPLGILGGLFHLFNHSIFKSLLFLNSGALEQATGTRNLKEMGGLSKRMPTTSWTTLSASMSISGVPPFSGFWSKLIIVMACVEQGQWFYASWAILVSILTLASFLKVTKFAFLGRLRKRFEHVREVPVAMRFGMAVLALLCILGGLMLVPAAKEMLLDPAVRVLDHGVITLGEVVNL